MSVSPSLSLSLFLSNHLWMTFLNSNLLASPRKLQQRTCGPFFKSVSISCLNFEASLWNRALPSFGRLDHTGYPRHVKLRYRPSLWLGLRRKHDAPCVSRHHPSQDMYAGECWRWLALAVGCSSFLAQRRLCPVGRYFFCLTKWTPRSTALNENATAFWNNMCSLRKRQCSIWEQVQSHVWASTNCAPKTMTQVRLKQSQAIKNKSLGCFLGLLLNEAIVHITSKAKFLGCPSLLLLFPCNSPLVLTKSTLIFSQTPKRNTTWTSMNKHEQFTFTLRYWPQIDTIIIY